MTLTMRGYEGLDDLARMKKLVSEGKQVSPHSYYPHLGDVDWWMFYPSKGLMIIIVEDAGEMVGWAFMDAPESADIVVLPYLRGTAVETELIRYAEAQLEAQQKPGDMLIVFAWKDDSYRRDLLEGWGYTGREYLTYFTHSLEGALPTPMLPDGFLFIEAMRPEWADRRADVHFDAFSPSRMTTQAYTHFMTAPDYDPALDVAVVAPDGSFASFAMCWVDPASGVGSFEPVGTRASMQRKGLGRAALHEGLRRMRARGMTVASVLTHTEDAGNIAFYESAGFRQTTTILKYERQV